MEIGPASFNDMIRVWCSCGGNHGFVVWRDDQIFWVEFIPMKWSFFQRVSDAWGAFHGRPAHEVVLGCEQVEALADALNMELAKVNDKLWESTLADGLKDD